MAGNDPHHLKKFALEWILTNGIMPGFEERLKEVLPHWNVTEESRIVWRGQHSAENSKNKKTVMILGSNHTNLRTDLRPVISTSKYKEVALKFAGKSGILFEINVMRGVHFLDIHHVLSSLDFSVCEEGRSRKDQEKSELFVLLDAVRQFFPEEGTLKKRTPRQSLCKTILKRLEEHEILLEGGGAREYRLAVEDIESPILSGSALYTQYLAEKIPDTDIFLSFVTIYPSPPAKSKEGGSRKTKDKISKMKGVAVFEGSVEGHATFEDSSGGLKLQALFKKLPAGEHGFHIHVNGDLRDEGCMGACSHYNKGSKRNHGGAPSSSSSSLSKERHTGDLGNVSKIGHTYSYFLKGVTVSELLGRSLIVHADPDDLGHGDFEDSLTTGHSGKRIACALIGRAKDCADPVKRKTRKMSKV